MGLITSETTEQLPPFIIPMNVETADTTSYLEGRHLDNILIIALHCFKPGSRAFDQSEEPVHI